MVFSFFYVCVNCIVLLCNGMKYPENSEFTFLTSWFNLSEDYLTIYSSFYVGFGINFLTTLGIIASYEYFSKKCISMTGITSLQSDTLSFLE